jgi:hemerythrin superfamily protein
MLASELLKKDHEKVKSLFKQFEKQEDDPERARQTFEEIAKELQVHSKLEEQIFYPELRDYKETHDLVLEAVEEHHVVDTLIEELSGMSADDEAFSAKCTVLKENVEHHVEEEEGEFFPKAEKILGKARSEWLCEQMQQLKQQLAGESGGRKRKRA